MYPLLGDTEELATCREGVNSRGTPEDAFHKGRSGLDQMLAIVEDKQHLRVAQERNDIRDRIIG
jgi:hypothetical protein